MFSFRVDDADAAAVQLWADRLHIDRSEFLRAALRRHLSELTADHDAGAYVAQPITDEEKALGQIADWGPAEDWADWADAPR
ncbi:MAG: ribbon-helix-helix protein, CopG family [Mycobacterium sp.]